MALKILILGVCIALMVVVAILAVAGVNWVLNAPVAQPAGSKVVLVTSAVGAVLCLWLLWNSRRDRIR